MPSVNIILPLDMIKKLTPETMKDKIQIQTVRNGQFIKVDYLNIALGNTTYRITLGDDEDRLIINKNTDRENHRDDSLIIYPIVSNEIGIK